MADDLSRPRFQLEAMQAMVRMRIDLAKAESEIAMQYAKVAEQWIKNTVENLKRIQLERALQDYYRAKNEAEQRKRTQERNLNRLQNKTLHASQLALGESITHREVGHAWSGWLFLMIHAPNPAKVAIGTVPVGVEHRVRENFAKIDQRNLDHIAQVNAPDHIEFAGPLFDWCRVNSVVPRVGRPAYSLLAQMFTVLDLAAAEEARTIETLLTAAHAELKDIRQKGWQAVNVIK